MSHLNTAYELGVKQAEVDFQEELNKQSNAPLANLGAGTPPPRPVAKPIAQGPLPTAPAARQAPQGLLAAKPEFKM